MDSVTVVSRDDNTDIEKHLLHLVERTVLLYIFQPPLRAGMSRMLFGVSVVLARVKTKCCR